MHVNHLDSESTNEQLLRKKNNFLCLCQTPCTLLELLLLKDVEKIHLKELFLTSTVQFPNFTAPISPTFFTKLWEWYFLE